MAAADGAARGPRRRQLEISGGEFMLDGQPLQICAGDLFYTRVHPDLWEDRLRRVAALGVNAVQTYVMWNWHERAPGKYDFASPECDLGRFVRLAEEAGLLVLLRIGPYCCGEWELGGLPAHVIAPGAAEEVRTADASGRYERAWRAWFARLLPEIRPLLLENGGPVAMLQLENEYGAFGDVAGRPADRRYIEGLRDTVLAALGPGPVLFTTDQGFPDAVRRGALGPGNGVFSAVDFPPTAVGPVPFASLVSFPLADEANAPGPAPRFCSELYCGWIVHYGGPMVNRSSAELAGAVGTLLASGASLSVYVAHGGTNFGFWNGANDYGLGFGNVPDFRTSYAPHVTTYDYNAPISEHGGHGYGADGRDKYVALRDAILRATGRTPPPEPPEPRLEAYGDVVLGRALPLFRADALEAAAARTARTAAPLPMEALGQSLGFVQYEFPFEALPPFDPRAFVRLDLSGVCDRACVYLGDSLLGTAFRGDASGLRAIVEVGPEAIPAWAREAADRLWPSGRPAQRTVPTDAPAALPPLRILVENCGRVNYASKDNRGSLIDRKGLLGSVLLNLKPVGGAEWTTRCIPLEASQLRALRALPPAADLAPGAGPAFRWGTLVIDEGPPCDTYLSTRGWGKGVAFVNGFNLGRYWEGPGPQRALYVPRPVLRAGRNEVLLFEVDGAPDGLTVTFTGKPDLEQERPFARAAVDAIWKAMAGIDSRGKRSDTPRSRAQRS